ncbi:hypothetical protein XELAEV_18005612mg [Xenopus laevis]|nr:hypothetical protein XELAEV_18005612mg [Xenopus laevis]
MKQASKIISEEFYTITDTGSRDIKCRISALCCFVRELYDLEKYLRNLPEYAVYTNNTIINAVEFLKQLDASYSEKTKAVQYLEDQCEICDAPTTTKNIEGFVEDFEALLKNLATNL